MIETIKEISWLILTIYVVGVALINFIKSKSWFNFMLFFFCFYAFIVELEVYYINVSEQIAVYLLFYIFIPCTICILFMVLRDILRGHEEELGINLIVVKKHISYMIIIYILICIVEYLAKYL